MRRSNGLTALMLIIVTTGLLACGEAASNDDSASKGEPAQVEQEEPARVEEIEGTDLSRVILTQKAADRLGIETAAVRDEQLDGAQRKVIPYSAVLYDELGGAWVYTNPESLVFVRHQINVETIDGDLAILLDGPPSGAVVVTVGLAELYGTEFGVGH